MAGNVTKFVGSVVASPTVRLDLNDETIWTVRSFDPGVPSLRRSVSANSMVDGFHVAASSYDSRTITMVLQLRTATQDLNATQLQLLARELDRATNLIMYQPVGATKPVFFRTFRSPLAQINDILVQSAMREFTVELLAEPLALGLLETISVGTVNNDPAAGSNGCFFDVTGVIGDVAVPPVIYDAGDNDEGWLSVRQHGTPSDALVYFQAESGTSLVAATVTADAAASGGSMLRLSGGAFSADYAWTGTAAARLARPGRYRVMAVCKASATSTWTLALSGSTSNEALSIVTPSTTQYTVEEFGFITLESQAVGSGGVPTPGITGATLDFAGQRETGSGTLDVDFLVLLPADEGTLYFNADENIPSGERMILDSLHERVMHRESAAGSLFDGTTAVFVGDQAGSVGGFPTLIPNQTNRFYLIKIFTGTYDKTKTATITIYYFPLYVFVRPSAT